MIVLLLILILLFMPVGSRTPPDTSKRDWERQEADRAEAAYLESLKKKKDTPVQTRTFRKRMVHPDGRLEEETGREETYL